MARRARARDSEARLKRSWWVSGFVVCLATAATAQGSGPDRLRFFAMWDHNYLYVAAQLEDHSVVGKHSGLAQPVWLDDDVELFFELDNAKSRDLTSSCYWLGMSAAEGLWFAQGSNADDEGRWLPGNLLAPGARGFREAVKVQGTLNDISDVDQGWELEAALPWSLFGLDGPPVGRTWGFNLVRTLRGENDARYSYDRQALPAEAIKHPATWGWLAFRGSESSGAVGWLEPGEDDVAVCPRALGQVMVDGDVKGAEWQTLYGVTAELTLDRLAPVVPESYPFPPDKQRPLPDGCKFQLREFPERPPRQDISVERLVLAPYHLDYAADPHQPVPGAETRRADGGSLLSRHPLDGLGPWFSGLDSGWHQGQLQQAARALIDVLLVDYPTRVPVAFRQGAVRSLVLATEDLEQHGGAHPELGLHLPLAALTAITGPDPDLTQQVNQAALYGLIRDFYLAVPPPLRALVDDADGPACLVSLGAPTRAMRLSEGFLGACEARFREDFGLGLLWLGPTDWRRRGVHLDASIRLDAAQFPASLGQSRIATLSIGPGYDDTPTAPRPVVIPRLGRETLREAFGLVAPNAFGWLYFSSWNDFRRGDNLAASVEDGYLAERTATLLSLQFNAPEEKPWVAKFRQVEVPGTIAAGRTVQCPVRVINGGVRNWSGADQVQIGYRWYPEQRAYARKRDGTIVTDRNGKPVYRDLPLTTGGGRSEVLVSGTHQAVDVNVPVAAVDDAGQPLAPGRYRLRLDALAGEGETTRPVTDAAGDPVLDAAGQPKTETVTEPNWFSLRGDPTFDCYLDVVAPSALPAQAATVLDVALPPRLETGQRYPSRVAVRNDGAEPWDETARLAIRYDLVTSDPPCEGEPAAQQITGWLPLTPITTGSLKEQVRPGEVAALLTELPVARADGSPLPLLTSDSQAYRATIAVLGTDGRPMQASRPYTQTVELLQRDWGAGFWRVTAPRTLPAGGTAECTVAVVNTGFHSWTAEQTAVSYHWYYLDGTECRWDNPRTPLTKDLASGETVEVTVPLAAPDLPGPYVAVFDVLHHGEVWSSRLPSTYPRQTIRWPVEVVGHQLEPLDLSRYYNVTAQSTERNPNGGDFDGTGQSWPYEMMPPSGDDIAQGLYPSGYRCAPDDAPAWQRSIVFRYPRLRTNGPSAVRPEGQGLRIRAGSYRRLHLLAAAIGKDTPLELSVLTQRGLKPLPGVMVTTWDQRPAHGELLGFMTYYRHGPQGIVPDRKCYLHHIVVDLDPQWVIGAITLPRAANLRILAMTLEAAPES